MAYAAKSDGYGRNAGKRWRREDVADLRALVRRGASLRLISLRLGRPDSAIRAKAGELGLSVNEGETIVAPPPERTLSRSPSRTRFQGAMPASPIEARQLELFRSA